MKVRVRSRSRISNATFHRRCFSEGQRYWWVRSVDSGEFIRLPERVRGDAYLDLVLDLPPGRYQMGAGPRGKFGVREEFEVREEASNA